MNARRMLRAGWALVPLSDMAGWRFYDDATWMDNAYRHGVSQRWERERKEAGSSDAPEVAEVA